MKITNFEDLKAWQKGRELTQKIYQITKHDAFSKDWGLKDQICRASGSIMHNRFDSGSDAEFLRFLRYAHRSATEVQSQLYVALDQAYIDTSTFNQLYGLTKETHSIVGGLIKYLAKS